MPCSLPPYFFESLKLCVHRLPRRRFPDIRRNEKSHSSKISLRKVALNKRNLYFSFLPLGTAFCRFPYYSVLSGIVGTNFAVLLLYFFISEARKLDFTAFLNSKTSRSGDVEHGLTIPFKGLQNPSLRSFFWFQKCP